MSDHPVTNGHKDVWSYRVSVLALAGVAVAGLIGACLLAALDRQAPGELWVVVGAAVGGLAGVVQPRRAPAG